MLKKKKRVVNKIIMLLSSILLTLQMNAQTVSPPTGVHFNIEPYGMDLSLPPMSDTINPVHYILMNSDSMDFLLKTGQI